MNNTRHILFLVGISGSGKSTFALEHVRRHSNYKRVNKDELRFMIHDEDFKGFDRRKETFVLSCRDHILRQALNDGYNVVVDDTNLEEKHFAKVCQIAEQVARAKDVTVTVQVKVFDTPLDECLRRNALRSGKTCIPEDVIRKMHKRLATTPLRTEKGRTFFAGGATPRLYVPGLPECVVADMDGTTSLLNGRNPYDAKGCINDLPNLPVLGLLHDLMHRYPIVITSGREDKDQAETEQWLRDHGVLFYDPERDETMRGIVGVHLRKTGDSRKDGVIKREMYETHILPNFNVKFHLDDRQRVVDAIRDLGIPVFQVAPGDF